MSLTFGKQGVLSFASANIIGSSNEDRHCHYLNHSLLKSSNEELISKIDEIEGIISSFGIFDGHNGVSAFPLNCILRGHVMMIITWTWLVFY